MANNATSFLSGLEIRFEVRVQPLLEPELTKRFGFGPGLEGLGTGPWLV